MYRLAADIFNDTAMILDCLSPALPKVSRVVLLSFSSVLRALCGVCAGSSKASLSAHFARWGNLGELNAVRACYMRTSDALPYAIYARRSITSKPVPMLLIQFVPHVESSKDITDDLV